MIWIDDCADNETDTSSDWGDAACVSFADFRAKKPYLQNKEIFAVLYRFLDRCN